MRVPLTIAAAILGLMISGCESEYDGPAERAGEKIDKAVEKTGEKIDEAADAAERKLEETGDKVREKTQ